MEAFTLDLNPQPAARSARFLQRLVIFLQGLVNLVIVFWSEGTMRYVNFIVGVAIVILALMYRKVYKPA